MTSTIYLNIVNMPIYDFGIIVKF